MIERNDGGPAFARSAYDEGNLWNSPQPGMTLRDYFAAQVIQGLLANAECSSTNDEVAKEAFRVADAMLAAREVTP